MVQFDSMDKHISKNADTEHLASDVIHYREYKILLQPDRFTSKNGFLDFWGAASKTLKKLGLKVDVDEHAFDSQVREVLFYDTPQFDLYNHHFILRKRTFYDQGWPRPEHELTFKYRDPELKNAAAVEVRPQLGGHDEVKFKEELLLDAIGSAECAASIRMAGADLAQDRARPRRRGHNARVSDAEEDRHQAEDENGAGQ